MTQAKTTVLSDAEVLEALSRAGKNYEELLRINEWLAEFNLESFDGYYYRDINYPLGLVIKE